MKTLNSFKTALLAFIVGTLTLVTTPASAAFVSVYNDGPNVVLHINDQGTWVVDKNKDNASLVYQYDVYGTTVVLIHSTSGRACEDNYLVVVAQGDKFNSRKVDGCYFPQYSINVKADEWINFNFHGPKGEQNVTWNF